MGAEASTPAEKAQPEDDVDIVTEDYGKARAVFAERCVISALRNRTVDTARLWAPHVCLRALPQRACDSTLGAGSRRASVRSQSPHAGSPELVQCQEGCNQVGDPQQEGCVP